MFKRLLPLIILAGVLVFIALKATRPEPAEVTATASWRVEVQAITPGSQVPVLPLYGEVLAPDQQTISTLAGRVAERPVSEGMSVKQRFAAGAGRSGHRPGIGPGPGQVDDQISPNRCATATTRQP